jgi:hypothetical protein
MTSHKQTTDRANVLPDAHGWREITVRTFESWDDAKIKSRTTLKTNTSGFVDILMEEYTGETRRAKLTSVRLENEAAQVLFQMLRDTSGIGH